MIGISLNRIKKIKFIIFLLTIFIQGCNETSNLKKFINENHEVIQYFQNNYPDQGAGFFLSFMGEKNKGTGNQFSYWLKNENFSGYLYTKNLFKNKMNFSIIALIDYQNIHFSMNQKSNKKSHQITYLPGEEKLIHLKFSNISEGAHDLLILIMAHDENALSSVFGIKKTLFFNDNKFKNFPVESYKNVINENKLLFEEKKENYKVYIDHSFLGKIQKIIVMAFHKNTFVPFNGNSPGKIYQLDQKLNKGSMKLVFQKNQFLSNKPITKFILIGEPFIPKELKLGKINKKINYLIYEIKHIKNFDEE